MDGASLKDRIKRILSLVEDEDLAAELVIATVEDDVRQRRSALAAASGRRGAEARKLFTGWRAPIGKTKHPGSTLPAPLKGAKNGPQHSGSYSDSGSGSGLEKISECSGPSDKPSLMAFPIRGKGVSEWHLTQPVVNDLVLAFPGLDVLQECRRALAWVNGGAANRKTFTGMRRFLFRWVDRAANQGRSKLFQAAAIGRRLEDIPTLK